MKFRLSSIEGLEELLKPERLERLLKLEKERRGQPKDSLVFIGMANTAEYYWCGIKAWFLNKRSELGFFGAYLVDRIRYSLILGRIDKVPEGDEEILETGSDLTLEDVEEILKKRKEKQLPRIAVENPEDWEEIEKELVAKFGGVPSEFVVWEIDEERLKEDPLYRGRILEIKHAEKYPKVRWNFEWGKYVVVGVPDGITDEFVYEFKSTTSSGGFAKKWLKPIAETQADLYGFFFRRKKKRVQIYSLKDNKTYTWEGVVDEGRAKEVLEKFEKVDSGELPPPPASWKCRRCEFANECPVKSSQPL